MARANAKHADIEIVNLQRHPLASGRTYCSAEIVMEDGRVGVDDVSGSWTIYEKVYDGPITRPHGVRNELRVTLMPWAAEQMQAAASKLFVDGEPAEAAPRIKRRGP